MELARETQTQIQHADFLSDPAGRVYEWRITSWSGAVRCALGTAAWWRYVIALAAVLAPALWTTAYGALNARWGLLMLGLAGLWGYCTSSTQPTGIGMLAAMFIAAVGAAAGMMRSDWVLMAAACLPGVAWFASCAILGVTASYLVERLGSSAECFDDLVQRGLLLATRRAAPSPSGKPES